MWNPMSILNMDLLSLMLTVAHMLFSWGLGSKVKANKLEGTCFCGNVGGLCSYCTYHQFLLEFESSFCHLHLALRLKVERVCREG